MQAEKPGKVSRNEWLPVLGIAAGVMILTVLPYARAVQMAGAGEYFCGFLWGVDEGNVYLAWLRQAAAGRWLLANQYTIAPQNPHFFNIFLILLGRFCALTGLAPIVVFHLARFLGGMFLLGAFYLLVAEITASRRIRLAALLIAALSSGLGWIVYLQAKMSDLPLGAWDGLRPMDVAYGWQAQPEAVTFLSLLLNPLFVTSMGLLCLVLRYGLRAARTNGLRSAVASGMLLLILGNVHTYDALIVYLALFVWFVLVVAQGTIAWRAAASRYAVITLLGLPGLLWAYYTMRLDPAYSQKAATMTRSAMPWDYAIGYGLVFLLALVGTVVVIRLRRTAAGGVGEKFNRELAFPVVWAVLGFGLLYLPVSFQRKLIEGLHLPLCILAAVALTRLHSWLGGRVSFALLLVVFVLLTLPSNVLFVADCLDHLAVNNVDLLRYLMPPAYLSKAEMTALRWLDSTAAPGSVVLSSSLMGSHIPAHTCCRVVTGHWAETLRFGEMLKLAGYFYLPGQEPAVRREILQRTGTDFVFYGPQERLLQQGMAAGGQFELDAQWDPSIGLPELKLAFVGDGLRIYRVRE